MKNVFDPQGNLDEWIQNDWESDDYIESQMENQTETEPTFENEEKAPAWAVILAIAIFLARSPIFWIVVFFLIFRFGK